MKVFVSADLDLLVEEDWHANDLHQKIGNGWVSYRRLDARWLCWLNRRTERALADAKLPDAVRQDIALRWSAVLAQARTLLGVLIVDQALSRRPSADYFPPVFPKRYAA